MIKQNSYAITKAEVDGNKKWYVVDATDMVVGRMCSEIAKVLRGKNKPTFCTNNDAGDFVIVINAEKVKMTGKREQLKKYIWHSMYPGGQKIRSYEDMKNKKPEYAIQEAVRGMLPKNRLGKSLITKLKVYAGEEHPHKAQKPEILSTSEK